MKKSDFDSQERRDFFKLAAATAGLTVLAGLSGCVPGTDDKNDNSDGKKAKADFRNELELDESLVNFISATYSETEEPISLEDGRSFFLKNETLWDILKQRVQTLYAIPETDVTKTPEDIFKCIDFDYQFKKLPQDDDFHYQHVEMLIDQASAILERCIRDRSEWNEKYVRSFQIRCELTNFYSLDQIHEEEVQNGYYTMPYEEALSNLNAEKYVAAGYRNSYSIINRLLESKYNHEELEKQSGWAQLTAWLSHIAAYEKPETGNFVNVIWNGTPSTAPKFCQDSAMHQSWFNFNSQISVLSSQRRNYLTNAEASEKRIEGLQKKVEWEKQDIVFKRRRTEVAREIAFSKIKAFVEEDGALNYPQHMAEIKKRFQRDLRDSLARIFIVHEGMNKIYGYTASLPASLQNILSGASNKSGMLLDECINWLRETTSWIVRFSQLDQNYVKAFSIRKLNRGLEEDDSKWQIGLENGSWNFYIGEKLFPDQTHVRLRGVSAFVVYENGLCDYDIWELDIHPPKQSFCTHLSGTKSQLNQTVIPMIRLGRVSSRELSSANPDIVGISALHNVSPFGVWAIKLYQNSESNVRIQGIKDVYIDFHFAVRTAYKS